MDYFGHEHLLELRDIKHWESQSCLACFIIISGESAYSCSMCGHFIHVIACFIIVGHALNCQERFSVHLCCLPDLPPIVKHKCHLHPLALTRSPIKDYEDEDDSDDSEEFYCDACEQLRILSDPTYCCTEGCHFVADVYCVVSEVLPYMQRGLSSEDRIVIMDGADDSSALLATMPEEFRNIQIVGDPLLDELDANIATIQSEVDELKTQLEIRTAKLDQLKERRNQHAVTLSQHSDS